MWWCRGTGNKGVGGEEEGELEVVGMVLVLV